MGGSFLYFFFGFRVRVGAGLFSSFENEIVVTRVAHRRIVTDCFPVRFCQGIMGVVGDFCWVVRTRISGFVAPFVPASVACILWCRFVFLKVGGGLLREFRFGFSL